MLYIPVHTHSSKAVRQYYKLDILIGVDSETMCQRIPKNFEREVLHWHTGVGRECTLLSSAKLFRMQCKAGVCPALQPASQSQLVISRQVCEENQ